MSGDPEQEFFADGLTEDIITELSRFRELLVISRNAVFVHKGKPVKAQEIAPRIRRRLRGRGQRAQGGRPRARHRAAHRRRDRDARLGRALRPQARGHLRDPGRGDLVDRRDAVRPRRGRDARPRAAQAHREHGGLRVCARPARSCTTASNREANAEALRMLDRAIELDPNYAHAHAWKACVLGQAWLSRLVRRPRGHAAR